jgi:malonyl-CoA O-methyltransferase
MQMGGKHQDSIFLIVRNIVIPTLESKKLITVTPAAYAAAAVLANLVSAEMLSRLDLMTLQPKVILDAGCGTGLGSRLLRERYPAAMIVAMDMQYPMLQFVREQEDSAAELVCADAQVLPLGSQTVDLIFANFVLPWCDRQEKVLQEWRRVLRPEGLLMFSTLGPDTLLAWRKELADITLPDFIDMHETGDSLMRAKFSDPVMDVEYYTVNYGKGEDFLRELHASSMLASTPSIAINTENKNWDAVYEVIYGHAFGPDVAVDQVSDDEGIINIPLAQLRRSLRRDRE